MEEQEHRLDSCTTSGVDGKGMVFRPLNHPLLDVKMNCPSCGAEEGDISLPSYPGDYFDCRCGESIKPTKRQVYTMWQSWRK